MFKFNLGDVCRIGKSDTLVLITQQIDWKGKIFYRVHFCDPVKDKYLNHMISENSLFLYEGVDCSKCSVEECDFYYTCSCSVYRENDDV